MLSTDKRSMYLMLMLGLMKLYLLSFAVLVGMVTCRGGKIVMS